MEVGTFISLKRYNFDIQELENYHCKIVDVDETYFYIDYPIHQKTKRTEKFAVGEKVVAQYMKKGVAHEFNTTVIARVDKNVPALKLEIPNKDDVKRIQRREFVRIATDVDVAVHSPDESFPPFTSITEDISGGGAKIYNPPEYLQENDKLELYLVLPMKDHYEYLKTEAEVVRFHEQNNVRTMSVKFLIDQEIDRQKIIHYCFYIQRKNRQLGKI